MKLCCQNPFQLSPDLCWLNIWHKLELQLLHLQREPISTVMVQQCRATCWTNSSSQSLTSALMSMGAALRTGATFVHANSCPVSSSRNVIVLCSTHALNMQKCLLCVCSLHALCRNKSCAVVMLCKRLAPNVLWCVQVQLPPRGAASP